MFHMGERHVFTVGSLAPSCGSAAQRLHATNSFFRDLLMTFDRRCRYSLSRAFCAENAVLALRAPPLHAAWRGASRHSRFS